VSFLTWAALGVAALVALPLLAHWLRRRPPQELPFAPARLVPAGAAHAHRRSGIEDKTLFVIRAIAVVSLAVLGATPLVRCSRLSIARPAGASVAVAVVVDDSLSMQAPLAGETDGPSRFERAVEAAHQLIASLRSGDAVTVILAGEPARVALGATTNLDMAKTVLAEVQPSDRATDLEGALAHAEQLLRGLRQVDKRVVLLSDLADGKSAAAPLRAKPGMALWVPLDELREARPNCGVVQADRSGDRVVVRIACGGAGNTDAAVPTAAESAAERRVVIRRREQELAAEPLGACDRLCDRVLPLPREPWSTARAAASAASAAAPLSGEEKGQGGGPHLWAQLSGDDAVRADDQAPVVMLGGQLRVGLVGGAAEDQVVTGGPPPVEQALAALSLGVQLQPLPGVPEDAVGLDRLSVLIVDDVPGFTPSLRRRLASWVERGGVLLLTLGPRAAAAPLGSGFAPLLPSVVRWAPISAGSAVGAAGAAARSARVRGVDASSDQLFGPTVEGLLDIKPQGRASLALPADSGIEAVASWQDGAPFLLRHRLGRGVGYIVTVPFDTDQSDLALRPAFLALLRHVVETARTLGGMARSSVGTSWDLAGFRSAKVRRVMTDGGLEAVAVQGGAGQYRMVPTRLGLYELELDGQLAHRVAALPEREADLRPRAVEHSPSPGALGGLESSVDVSRWIALVLLGLLCAELGMRGLRHRRRLGSVPSRSGK